ncbi:MAG TPA: rhodanese-like domain-containing protein [Pyrinomonadaceae bacterium]|jgi:hypothetical protein
MRFILSITAACALALVVLTACSQNSSGPLKANNSGLAQKTPERAQMDDAARISLADAKKEFDEGTAVFVDTRAEVLYRQEHVKGSINLPMEAFETRYKEIPTDKKIIAYCS